MVHSAYGALASDVIHTAELSLLLRGGGHGREPWDGIDATAITQGFDSLERSCAALLADNGIDSDGMVMLRTADVRYRRQTNELLVSWDSDPADGRAPVADLIERFEGTYAANFGQGAGFREAGIEITTLAARSRCPGPGRSTTSAGAPECRRQSGAGWTSRLDSSSTDRP